MYDQLLKLINERQDKQKMIERKRVLKRVSCLKNNVVGARPKQRTLQKFVVTTRPSLLPEKFYTKPNMKILN